MSGNQEGHGGVGELVKEEQYDRVVKHRKVNKRVMSFALFFYVEVVVVVVCSSEQSP